MSLGRLIPLEGWEAIKCFPPVLSAITNQIGIITENEGQANVELLEQLEQSVASLFILSACCLDESLRSKGLLLLTNFAKNVELKESIDEEMLFSFITCPVFTRRSDGLQYSLASRSYPLLSKVLYEKESFIISGLNHPDSGARKQALFICKQLIQAKQPGVNNLLYCRKDDLKSWSDMWNSFFILYDTFQEPQSHLLEPLLPMLPQLLTLMGLGWWECVMRRAFENTSVAVRKKLLEHLITVFPFSEFSELRDSETFVFGCMLELVDNSYLYSAIDFTRLVSPFGLLVTKFYGEFFEMAKDQESRSLRVLLLVQKLAGLTSNMAIIFLMNAVLQTDNIEFSGLDLNTIVSLAEHRGFTTTRPESCSRSSSSKRSQGFASFNNSQ